MVLRNYRNRWMLVLRFSAIGDIILTLPVVEALKDRFPEAKIDFAIKKEFVRLVAHHPLIHKVHAFDRDLGFEGLKRLKALIDETGYDLLLDLHHNLRSTYLRLSSSARIKRVYRKNSLDRTLLTRFGINLMNGAAPVCDRYFTALEDFGIVRRNRRPRLFFEAGLKPRMEKLLSERGLPPGAQYLAVAPGASYPTKRWPGSRFVEAATALANGSMKTVVLGGNEDRELSRAMADELDQHHQKALDLAGKLTLEESAAVIEGAALVLTNDSGLMHVADAMDRPLVAVFGPTSRELGFYPLGPRSRVVEIPDLECRPCTLHGNQACAKGHHRCMNEIPVEKVVAAAQEALAS